MTKFEVTAAAFCARASLDLAQRSDLGPDGTAVRLVAAG
jgi:hypothetical protein